LKVMGVKWFLTLMCCGAFCQWGGAKAAAQVSEVDPSGLTAPRQFVTHHTGTFGGTLVHYTATAADVPLEDENGKLIGYVFSFTYTADSAKNANARPVMFIFNGGPGSASLWTHVGGFGPKRVSVPAPSDTSTASARLLDNASSLLDVADLVFIDPIGTGFSRPAGDGKLEQYFDVRKDAEATAEFIRRWLAQTNRWGSPKYMLGESYGTTRAALTAKYLMGGVDTGHLPLIAMNGIALLGTALTLGLPPTDADFVGLLPSQAATAWFHDRIDKGGRSLASLVAEVTQFAQQEYAAALYAGSLLPDGRRQEIAARLHSYTGLSENFILRNDLRVAMRPFAAELLADSGQSVSIVDGRYTGGTPRAPFDPVSDDPSLTRTSPFMLDGFMTYIRTDLGVTLNTRYETTSFVANGQWRWLEDNYNLAVELGRAMRQNPALHLFVGQGYYDLTTPTGTAMYALTHGGVPMNRVSVKQYESGHVIYITDGEQRQLSADLRSFVKSTRN